MRIPNAPLFLLLAAAPALRAQQHPLAYVPVDGVTVSGPLEVANGRASVGNNGVITAGTATAEVTLVRGGTLKLCASTSIHLSTDRTAQQAGNDSALMLALDHGALEASYKPGQYSDVVMTPDLRILISGPGYADVKIRVNQKGDTCVDNHGAEAPYVTATNLFEGGVYRIQPNQRVLFEHGSLEQVVDNEPEPCGCPAAPPPVSVASTGGSTPASATQPGRPAATKVGGPSSTPADTAFPLAESEGLVPPPPPPGEPVVPAGEAHAEVSVPLSFSGTAPPPQPPPATRETAAPPTQSMASASASGAALSQPPESAAPRAAAPDQQPVAQKQTKPHGFFHHIGHFFSRLFGG